MKNQTFDIHRFGNLWSYDLRSNMKSHLGFIILLYGSALISIFFDFANNISSAAFVVYCMASVIGPMVFTTRIFRNLRQKGSKIDFLMLPASNLEKFGVRWINQVILPFAVVWIASLLFSATQTSIFEVLQAGRAMTGNVEFVSFIGIALFSFVGYSLCVNFTIFGATLLKRYAFFITQLVIVVTILIMSYCLSFVVDDELIRSFVVTEMQDSLTVVQYLAPKFYILVGAELLVSLTFLWGAYKAFCKKTV